MEHTTPRPPRRITSPQLAKFIEHVRVAFEQRTLIKLTLSDVKSGEEDLKNVYARLVELKDGPHIQFNRRYRARDIASNLRPRDAVNYVLQLLDEDFSQAYLFTVSADYKLKEQDTGAYRIKTSAPSQHAVPDVGHDKKKHESLSDAALWLQTLGVTQQSGQARLGMADKLRQIQRYTEVLGHLLDQSPLKDRTELTVLDMGAGKGYLTFAVHEFLTRRGVTPNVIGVEAREELVKFTNEAVERCQLKGLRFVRGTIAECPNLPTPDVLIALHACDTATDDALHRGVKARAPLLIASPCCHRELRPQLRVPQWLDPVFRHGILRERESETLTDAMRGLLLDIAGYRSEIFEFISPEHTARNLMLAAHLRETPADPEPLRARLREMAGQYGIHEQRLAGLLGESLAEA